MIATTAASILVTCLIVSLVQSHGYMLVPPGRASMWREGWPTPVQYSDNQMFCGGFQHQWEINEGKCGVCGDPFDGVRVHEAGGAYATGTIVRHYTRGQVVPVTVIITANHRGYFQFSICKVANYTTKATQACMSSTRLQLASGGLKYHVTSNRVGTYNISVKLPTTLLCNQCVLQWKYNSGNSWGVNSNGHGCVGCGPQEQFYACADVRISLLGGHVSIPTTTPTPTTPDPVDPEAQLGLCTGGLYKSTYLYRFQAARITAWCMMMCNIHRADRNCPMSHCECAP